MRVTVRVPATAANLGPGYDCFGLALDLCNEWTIDTSEEPSISWEGEGGDELPVDGSDLVSRTVQAIAARMELEAPRYSLTGRNRIPLERGLGSSAAASVAGVVIASALLDLRWHADAATVFAAAAGIEGHPDNAAPAVHGGFTIAMPDGFVHRLDPHPDLRPVALIPPTRLSTEQAREGLPAEVALPDAVFNLAHAALAVEALTSEPSLLVRAMADRLHQDVRIAMAGIDDVVRDLGRVGVPFCVAGAGPTLLAFEIEGVPEVTAELLGLSPAWRILRPGVRAKGFEVEADA